MRRSGRTSDRYREEPETSGLFDLPLVLDPSEPPATEPASEPEPQLPAEPAHSDLLLDLEPIAEGREEEVAEAEASEIPGLAAGLLRRRLLAGLFDLAVTTAAWTILLLAALFMGAGLRASDWPGYLLALASFSFVYTVYSLVFWGRTPGMRRARLAAHSDNGAPITVGQAVLRWIGGAVTALLLGLPSLLLLRGGRSFTDYVSDSSLGS